MSDFTPTLNGVKIESPTEDGKIAYVMNTMVPRRLEQFDDIRADLENKNFDTDKAYFYVNFQAGDFCGRSYKLPLSELNEFVTKSLLVGTNGKEPTMKFDDNMYSDEEGIHLIVDLDSIKDHRIREKIEDILADDPERAKNLLLKALIDLRKADKDLRLSLYRFGEEDSEGVIDPTKPIGDIHLLEAEDIRLEEEKNNKFIVLGDGDKLDYSDPDNPVPVPLTVEETDEPYGVHVTYNPTNSEGEPIYHGPKIGTDASGDPIFGPVIQINHEAVVPKGGWFSKYDVGGIAKGQFIPGGTKLIDV